MFHSPRITVEFMTPPRRDGGFPSECNVRIPWMVGRAGVEQIGNGGRVS